MNRCARSFRFGATLLAAVGTLAIGCPASAALYKWVDATGRVVYSDQPPIGDVNTESLRPAAPPSNPNAVKDMAAREMELKQRVADREEEARKADRSRADAQQRQEFCTRVRTEIARLQYSDQILLYRFNERGERVYMDDTARRVERERLEKLATDSCRS